MTVTDCVFYEVHTEAEATVFITETGFFYICEVENETDERAEHKS